MFVVYFYDDLLGLYFYYDLLGARINSSTGSVENEHSYKYDSKWVFILCCILIYLFSGRLCPGDVYILLSNTYFIVVSANVVAITFMLSLDYGGGGERECDVSWYKHRHFQHLNTTIYLKEDNNARNKWMLKH